MPPTPPEDKATLRTRLLAERRAVAAARDRSVDDRAIAGHVLRLVSDLHLGRGATVAAYEAMRTEPPTAVTLDALGAHGIRVLVPITLADNDLDWCDAHDATRMPAGPDAVATAGLVLTPGLAVDAHGTRLGRGGGSYDRALARRGPGSRVLCVLHPGELRTEPLPRDLHDRPVDGVLTADGVTWLGPGRGRPD